MKFKRKLLFGWLLSQLWLVNQAAIWISMLWVLQTKRPLYEQWMEGVVFIAIHAFAVVVTLNWRDSSRMGYLYTRGFSRNTLWSHQMWASLFSACHVLGPVSLCILTPFRSYLQERIGNPAYPFVAERDASVLPAWVLAYAIAFSGFHYIWIRRKHPTSGGWAGAWLVGIALIAFGWFGNFSSLILQGGWLSLYGVVLSLAFALLLSIQSRKLHQNIELH